ncbi:MAG: hypothetical protein HXY34_12975 [Candidatus Thorarchaeota archaeon]|nr:hypothetical protein [Candidatus Thorarchaeota archaeon]
MKTRTQTYIDRIGTSIQQMQELVSEAFTLSIEAFKGLDKETALRAQEISFRVAEMADAIEEDVFQTIARRQPVARDLRALASYNFVALHLSRIGRYAYKVSHIVKLAQGLSHYKELISIPQMTQNAIECLNIAVKALLEGDLSNIAALEKLEAETDGETVEMFHEITEYLRKRQDITLMSMYYMIVGRYCERAADHAFSIAERAVYVHTGKRVHLGLAYKGKFDTAPH